MFGKIKKGINDILTESYSNKKTFKRNFNVLMGSLRQTKTLREFFTLYGEIDKQRFADKNEARIFNRFFGKNKCLFFRTRHYESAPSSKRSNRY